MPKFRKRKHRQKQVSGVKTSGDPSKGHVDGKRVNHYDDIIKSNPVFEQYYKAQNIVPEGEWDQFLDSLRASLPATFRITGYKSHASALLGIIQSKYFNELLNEEHSKPKSLPWYPNNLGWQLNMSRIVIRKSESLARLHTFLVGETESGNISRQEAVSMIPPLVLDVKSHHKVLDLCAAPGSKTAQLIEMLHDNEETVPSGVVVANDVDNKRCYLLVHQTKRLQSPCFLITNHDATIFPNIQLKDTNGDANKMLFDRVLCDVPCSGDGTIRKNYEVWKKWNVANPNNLHHIQMKVLKRGLELLTNGGRLVYSTCSLNPIENEAVIAATLQLCEGSVELIDVRNELPGLIANPGLLTWKVMNRQMTVIESVEDIPEKDLTQIKATMFPPSLDKAKEINLDKCIRILPHHQDTGCFFVAVLHKKSTLPWQKAENIPNKEDIPESVTFSRKNKKGMGYKEDPFFFFKENETAWLQLKDCYDIKDFPDDQLLTRCETGKKRNIYFVSSIVKNILSNNDGKVKIINSGLRLFCRSDNKGTACEFRVTQEGIPAVLPHVRKRTLEITIEDIAHLLTKEYPDIRVMSEETREKLKDFDTGSVFLILNTTDLSGNKLNINLCGWKGKASLRCYVPRGERLHYLRLCNVDISKYEVNPNKKFKSTVNNNEENDIENKEANGNEDDQKLNVKTDGPSDSESNVEPSNVEEMET